MTTTGTARSSSGLDARRRKLLFRSWHRGIREMDLILGRFADARIAELGERELDDYDRLIGYPDPDLYLWVTGQAPVPADCDNALFASLCAFHRAAGPAR
jgi:antitoxin CptB